MTTIAAFDSPTTLIPLPGVTARSSAGGRTAPCPSLLRKVDALRRMPCFADADDTELTRLAESAMLRRFERGRTVPRAAANDDCLLLVEGRAKNSTPRGVACGEFALGFFESGEILWEGCWAAESVSVETIALETSIVLFLPRRALDAFLARNAAVAMRFLEAMATKLHRAMDLATQNSCLEVGDRLYRKLVELAATRGRWTDDGTIRIEHGLYQGELGASIGASREAVNRQFSMWKQQGLVDSGRKVVVVKNPRGLTLAVSGAVRGVDFPEPDGRVVTQGL